MKAKTIISFAALAVFLVILLQNMDSTTIQILFWPINVPLLILILSSIFVGWLLGWFTHLAYYKGKRKDSAAAQVTQVKEATEANEAEANRSPTHETSSEGAAKA